MKLNKTFINRDMYSINALTYDIQGNEWEELDDNSGIIWQVMAISEVLKSQSDNINDHIIVFYDLQNKCVIDIAVEDCFIDFDVWLFARKMSKAINLAFKHGTIRINK